MSGSSQIYTRCFRIISPPNQIMGNTKWLPNLKKITRAKKSMREGNCEKKTKTWELFLAENTIESMQWEGAISSNN